MELMWSPQAHHISLPRPVMRQRVNVFQCPMEKHAI